MPNPYREIESIQQLMDEPTKRFVHCAFQDIDFSEIKDEINHEWSFVDCIFMGCKIVPSMSIGIDCVVFPKMDKPYNPYRSKLYSPSELYAFNENEQCFDSKVYAHYLKYGKQSQDIAETLARSLHDHAILDALYDFLAQYDERNVVAIMGGHAMLRTDEVYRKVVNIAKRLTEQGKLLVSGGGPGAMEATHLGAWMAGRTEEEVENALSLLAVAPHYTDAKWLDVAFEVIKQYPQDVYKSVSIPTWLYGHEPSTPFATHIAKLFANALREDELLTIAKGGIIYSPGSAGTMQEIFQDAVQNHYLSFGYSSPMVFLGVEHWMRTIPVYELLMTLKQSKKYQNLQLSISDEEDEIVKTIVEFY